MTVTGTDVDQFLAQLADDAQRTARFEHVAVRDGVLVCRARGSAQPASYRVSLEGDRVWVSLVMADRWLSESIEADLMNTGDKIEELLDEELAELGFEGMSTSFEHFRSEDMLFTFRTPIKVPAAGLAPVAPETRGLLLAYEACFSLLGNMSADGDEP